ncbi:hypothetical protein EW026_g3513 [Hermanssonia centrifuga]|uniref:Uncharacterized protein n=1 Tax=Hermanssonia centrifuga TaxID=98765 RepID=A0A4S4KJW2_9APHY|nr:hypothetical protein EW026_g3513 [Hermanssonia centrifuga]
MPTALAGRNAHAVDGVVLPDVPECTYDEVPVFDSESGSSVSRKLYEKMESKINELETLLREKDRAIEHLQTSSITHISPIVTPGSDTKQLYPADFSSGSSKYNRTSEGTPPSVNGENGLYPQFAGHSSSPGSSVNSAEFPQFTPNSTLDGLTVDNFGLEIRSWPPNLPSPEITRHLVEAFFAFHIHAGRLFHMPTFMASLELLPTDLRFPSTAVLHAIYMTHLMILLTNFSTEGGEKRIHGLIISE